MQKQLGSHQNNISALGFGAGHIGGPDQDEKHIQALLETALELGILYFDTARGYNASEERLGKILKPYRDQILLSTKVGYGIAGQQDWSYDCIIAGVDQALAFMQTDCIDMIFLHSCDLDVLKQGEVIAALKQCQQAGKLKFCGYSGENEALHWALNSDQFEVLQCSVNLCDQWNLRHILPRALEKGIGIIAKRPLANAFWRFSYQPHGEYAENYWLRWVQMWPALASYLGPVDMEMDELALRFSLYTPGVSSGIIGTQRIENLKRNAELAKKGPLALEIRQWIEEAFIRSQAEIGAWRGEV